MDEVQLTLLIIVLLEDPTAPNCGNNICALGDMDVSNAEEIAEALKTQPTSGQSTPH